MSDDIRIQHASSMNASSNGASKLPWVILAVVVLVLIVVGIIFRDRLFSLNSSTTTTPQEQKLSGYQAVFLTNGQVYFGKLSDISASYATLLDIYYLQVTQPGLQGNQEGQQAAQSNQQSQLSLVKLGNELHGPVDEMKINRDQILFFEDIKEDGRVMQAIREYQKNPPTANQQTTAPANTPSANVNTTPAVI